MGGKQYAGGKPIKSSQLNKIYKMQYKKQLFEDTPINERAELLRNSCDRCERQSYARQLTPDEIMGKKDTLSDLMIEKSRIEEEMKLAMQDYKERLSPYKTEVQSNLQAIRTKVEECTGLVFYFAEHETGMMHVYDDKGDLIESRRLRPDEKVQTIMSAARTGTNE